MCIRDRDRGIVANGKTMSQAIKTLEETTELIDAINTNNLLEIVDAVGDIYVTLRGVCVVQGIDLEDCAKLAYNEIKDRKGHLRADGTFVKEHDRLPEKLLHSESYARIDIIGQNGNDGLHYDVAKRPPPINDYTPGPGPLDGKSAQQKFDEVAGAIDSYQHDASYYDTERNKPFEGLYERSIKEKHGRAVLTVSELMQEELEPIPDVTYSTDVKERAVWRDNPNDPKIIPFKEDSKDVD